MLNDWYFCRCLDADADRTLVTLSILDVLGDPSASTAVVGIAIEELARSDIWTRRYALPRLVTALRRPELARRRREQAYGLIAEAVVGRTANQDWTALSRRLADGAMPAELMPTLERCAAELDSNPTSSALLVPYVNLPVTGATVVVLAAAQGDKGEAVASALASNSSTALARVVEAALAHRHGRLAFLLAARLRLDHDPSSAGTGMFKSIAAAPGGCFMLEPDLLDLAAVAWNSRRDAANAAVDEEVLEEIAGISRKDYATRLLMLRRLDLRCIEEGFIRQHHSAIQFIDDCRRAFWQVACWNAAVDADPTAAMASFARHWTMPKALANPLTVPKVQMPAAQASVRMQFLSDLPLVVVEGQLPEGVGWIFSSPWLRKRISKAREPQHKVYPAGQELGPALYRLLGAQAALLRARRHTPAADAEPALLCFLLHARDVLTQVAHPNNNRDRAPWQVLVTAAGELAKGTVMRTVAPEKLVEAVENVEHTEEEGDSTHFARFAAPSALVLLAYDAYPSAVKGNPERAWFDALPAILELAKKTAPAEIVLAGALYRLVLGRRSLLKDSLDWRTIRYPSARQLLLIPDLVPEEWLQISEANARHALHIDLERLGALPEAENLWTLSAEVLLQVSAWSTAWRTTLGKAKESTDLDRLIVLRLVELVEAPALTGNLDDQLYLCTFVFEVGSPFDLDRLLERAFTWSTSPGERELRRKVAILAVRALQVAADEIEERDAPEPVGQGAGRLSRAAVIRNWLARFTADEDLRAVLRTSLARATDERAQAWRVLRCDVERRDGTEQLVPRADEPRVEVPVFHASVRDLRQQVVSLLLTDHGRDGARDLSRATTTPTQLESGDYVGTVVSQTQDGLFYVGLGRGVEVQVRAQGGQRYEPGMRVRLSLKLSQRGTLVKGISPLRPRRLPGDVVLAKLSSSGAGITLLVDGCAVRERITDQAWMGPADWWPDPRWRGGGEVYAMLGFDLAWRPLCADRVALLTLRTGLDLPPLIVVDAHEDADGQRQWTLLARPGQAFRLGVSDLTPGSREHIDRTESGLSLQFRATAEGLLEWISQDDILIQWANIFSDDSSVMATREGNVWYILLDERWERAGFPRRIAVEWERNPPADREHVEIEIRHWDPRRLRAKGRPASRDVSGVDLAVWCEQWIGLQKGDPVALVRFGKVAVDGSVVTAFTEANIRVTVPVESLTTQPNLAPEDIPRRNGFVEYVGPFRQLPDPVGHISDGDGAVLLSESITGLVVSLPMDRSSVGIWRLAVAERGWQTVEVTVNAKSEVPRLGDYFKLARTRDGLTLWLSQRGMSIRGIWQVRRQQGGGDAAWIHDASGSAEVSVSQLDWGQLAVAVNQSTSPRFESGELRRPERGANRRWILRGSGGAWVGESDGPLTQQPGRHRVSFIYHLWQVGQQGYDLRRKFLTAIPDGASKAPALRSAADEFERHVNGAIPVDIVLSEGGVYVQTLLLPDTVRTEKPNWLPLIANGGPAIPARNRRPGRAVILRGPIGLPVASCAAVPAEGIGSWFVRVAHSRTGVEVHLPRRLYYVGAERDEGPAGAIHHRFEEAPGVSLRVPEPQLRLDDAEFSRAGRSLFFGDEIHSVRFSKKGEVQADDRHEDEIGAEVGADDVFMHIGAFGTRLSDAHVLYRQATRWRMVHQLRVSGSDSTILSVDALDEGRTEERQLLLHPIGARLNVQAERRGDEAFALLGRMNIDRFLESRGRDVVFDRVRLTFGNGGLAPGERVFLRIKEVVQLRNDVKVSLEGLSDPVEDAEVTVLRKEFSAREDVLRRVVRRKADEELKGRVVLTTVFPPPPGLRHGPVEAIRGRVWDADAFDQRPDHFPLRSAGALRGHLERAMELPLVTWLGESAGAAAIEVRPGIFVRVPLSQVDVPERIERGAILRVELTNERFRFVRAAPGDGECVPPGGRTVSVLPMDSLAKDQNVYNQHPAFWNQALFSVESLPGVEAVVGRLGRPGEPATVGITDIHQLMRSAPPRIALLYRVGRTYLLDPTGHTDPMGRIGIQRDVLTFIDDCGAVHPLPWSRASYADIPRNDLSERLRREWFAHDNFTVRWLDHGVVERPEVPPRSALKGPIFAEFDDRGPRLRFTSASRPRFRLPPRELTDHIVGGSSIAVAVAGINVGSGHIELEFAPGRVVMVPAQLLTLVSGGAERSLSRLALATFCVGDELEIVLGEGDPLAVDRVSVVDWRPGARGSFSPDKTVLPVIHLDRTRGALVLGAGAYQLQIPTSDAELEMHRVGDVLEIDGFNEVRAAAGLHVGAGALLLRREQGLGLAGFDTFQVQFDPEWDWNNDPLRRWICDRDQVSNLLLDAVGGALPISIERVYQNCAYVSRRQQVVAVSSGQTLAGRLLGPLGDGHVLFRAGRLLLPVKLNHVVSGLPGGEEQEACVVEWLCGRTIWMHIDDQGEIVGGIQPDTRNQGWFDFVEPRGDVLSDSKGFVLCSHHNLALHWLPCANAAWLDLTHSVERMRWFLAQGTVEAVLTGRTGAASVVHHPRAMADFQAMQVGREVAVEILERDSPGVQIARSVASGVWLLYRGNEGGDQDSRAAIVSLRDVGAQRLIEVERLAARRVRLNLVPGLGHALGVSFPGPDAPTVGGVDALQTINTVIAAIEQERRVRASLPFHPSQTQMSEAHKSALIARQMVLELAQRALGSWHIEVLGNWLTGRLKVPASVVATRLDQLRAAVWHGEGGVSAVMQMESFRRLVELRSDRGDDDMLSLAAAASAAAGRAMPEIQAWQAIADITNCLIQIAALEPTGGANNLGVGAQTLELLRTVQQRLSKSGQAVLLCAPVPELSSSAYVDI